MDWLLPLVIGALPFLLLLACPVAMWFLMRGMGGQGMACAPREQAAARPEGRLAQLEREQGRLAAEIEATRRELETAAPARVRWQFLSEERSAQEDIRRSPAS